MNKVIEVANMTKIPKKYKGQWVAITLPNTKVVGCGKTPKEALTSANGRSNIAVTRVSEKSPSYLL